MNEEKYIPTQDKINKAAKLEQSPTTKYICSNSSQWHIGVRKDMRGSRSGLLMSVSYVTACTGQQLGGAWGQTEKTEHDGEVCERCRKIMEKSNAKA
jgi:hypothetical protein